MSLRRLSACAAVATLAVAACAPEPLLTTRGMGPSSQPVSASASSSASTTTTSSPSGSAAPSTAASATGEAADECRALAESLTPEERAGQLFMVGVSTGGLDEATRSAITDSRAGSVVLLGNSTAGSMPIRMLTAELGSLGSAKLPLLIAVDQEGGTVQRLKGEGFSDIPSARDQGGLPEGELREAAQSWAEELREAGVHYDLAPVGDIVPDAKRTSNEPIGKLQRDFGSDPAAVSRAVTEFVEGMQAGDVVTSIKHFPGLGEVETNTDFGAAEDSDVTRTSPHLEPFKAAIEAGVDSVMVSSAVFTNIDADNEGVFSEAVITDLLRGDLGFDGVVIADDLGAAVAVKDIEPADRAVRFIEAGGDLVINANPGLTRQMVAATLEAAEDEEFSGKVVDSVTRVLRLKDAAGLVACA